ncbi:MAG: glycine betaine ABC transporter substrate-binding protein [Bacillota bacterium]|uniref:Glycine betaine ABC transporter substrate-binding protein n=1 Tax=Virgibacillus salarius TaxID=447199 RepID=A0A941DX42_9BACI|nr:MULTISPECIES: glycine betaine ABC transporter substrate-binding protein [Bacillaceae]NAZ09786.1 glycine/betaine ABC transporter substrate-binding protein [Agaribacter marinus]MBR7797077.1 glycine betaine ABC transporter substrate-binding protein [Virgibacillus salarius]MCC2251924.1 glycine betaine ABC transporter substrate-binding protein [Virgibacillus sp. AGTR]MDY7044916.1 glycine betaine ABC transporter substrate-binding protein [Virgibacillus sp. M23]QRZ16464.1 glycine betaine ABC trans
MFKRNWKRLGLVAGLSLSLFAAGCGSDDESTGNGSDEGTASEGEAKEIELAYVEWDSEIASTHVVGKVLEDQGFDVKLTPLDNAVMWEAVANGEADGMVAAWLPATHADQYEEYGDQVEELGTNLEGAKIGLVVPKYMDVNSIEDLDAQANKTITGIEPGAGVVGAAEQALTDYDNLKGWEVQTSSSGAMATELGSAIENEEDIIVTGWTPHWKFAKYELKYLEDPKGTFGEAETIDTMVRKGLKDDMPNAYKILDQFNWTTEDMEAVMLEISNGTSPEDAAAAWVEENQEKVDEWVKGVE